MHDNTSKKDGTVFSKCYFDLKDLFKSKNLEKQEIKSG